MDSDEEHGPEVFETSDVESETGPVQPEEANENIARDPLAPPQSAVSSYEKSTLSDELTLVDFLGSVALRLASSGYNVERLRETKKQRIARIAQELEELEKEGPNEVDLLIEKFGQLKAEKSTKLSADLVLGEVFTKIDKALKKTGGSGAAEPNNVLDLERRIAELEDVIGSNEETPSSIRNIVNNTSRKVTVLYDHKDELATVKKEIQLLSKEMEVLATNRRMAQIASGSKDAPVLLVSFDQKVSSFYDRLAEFERVNSTVPLIIARLRSLNVVHSESGHAVQCVVNLDKTLATLALDMKKWDESVEKIDKSVEEQGRVFEGNVAVFEKKMNDVMERIGQLEARKS